MAKVSQRIRYAARYATSWLGLRARPSFLIIGAQKAGTTSLFHYLVQHPQIVPPLMKEVCFFSHPHRRRRGNAFYLAHFPLRNTMRSGQMTFEASPRYLYRADSAALIREFDPAMKLIVLVREPVARAFSHWNSFRDIWKTNPNYRNAKVDIDEWRTLESLLRPNGQMASFESLIEQEFPFVDSADAPQEPSLIRRGLYWRQLQPYLQSFPRQQLLVIETEELNRNAHVCLEQVCRFIDVDPFPPGLPQIAKYNERPYINQIEPSLCERLQSFYRPHNQALAEFLGHALEWNAVDQAAAGSGDER